MPREAPAQRNGELFRQVNERIYELEDPWHSAQRIGFVCECGALGCSTSIYLTNAEYAEVRCLDGCFVVALPHVDRRAEHVLKETAEYAIVEWLPT